LEQKFPNSRTSIELKIQKGLQKQSINNFIEQYPFKITLIDIAFPEQKIAVYCDGDYWHNLPGCKERDEKVNTFLASFGWKVLRFWEHDINNNLNQCLITIIESLKQRCIT
jgi:DNA mismatch endonuclease, patch repair protein